MTLFKKHKAHAATTTGEVLRPEQISTIREAESYLLPFDHDTIDKRLRALRNYSPPENSRSTSSHDEGPHKQSKGKGPDPLNWGAISAGSDEMDRDVQRAALEAWKFTQEQAQNSDGNQDSSDAVSHYVEQRKAIKARPAQPGVGVPVEQRENNCVIKEIAEPGERSTKKSTWKAKHISRRERDPVRKVVDKAIAQKTKQYGWKGTPKAMEPVEQVDPKSYIGLAFKQLGRSGKRARKMKWSRGSSSNSQTSTSSSAFDTSLNNSDDSGKISTSQSDSDSNSPSSGLSYPSSSDSSPSSSGHDSGSSKSRERSHRHC